MQRRPLLKSAAALPLTALLPWCRRAAPARPRQRVRAGGSAVAPTWAVAAARHLSAAAACREVLPTSAIPSISATSPAATSAFTLAIIADGDAPAYPGMPNAGGKTDAARHDAQAIDAATAERARVAPLGDSYLSESHYFNLRQRAYFGEHYAKFRAVKSKYDPDGLFFVHHGVG
jgi:FAD/FMN-containing dehydrogenase